MNFDWCKQIFRWTICIRIIRITLYECCIFYINVSDFQNWKHILVNWLIFGLICIADLLSIVRSSFVCNRSSRTENSFMLCINWHENKSTYPISNRWPALLNSATNEIFRWYYLMTTLFHRRWIGAIIKFRSFIVSHTVQSRSSDKLTTFNWIISLIRFLNLERNVANFFIIK